MDHLLSGRQAIESALANGHPVSSNDASLFPDVILRNSGSDVPDWLLPHMRRPNQSNKARYVVAKDTPFHVSVTFAGPVVSQVIKFEQNGVQKIVHEPYCINDERYAAAIEAYELVNEFVASPENFRNKFTASELQEKTTGAQKQNWRNNRASPRN